MKLTHVYLLLLVIGPSAWADYVENYKGTARSSGKISYIEYHKATFSDDKKIKSSVTIYKDEAGTTIGTLRSDFSKNLSAPSYQYNDLRHKTGHGIRYKNNVLQMIKTKEGEEEKTKDLTEKFSADSLIVGCQGLHYYLRENFDKVKKKKNIPIKFLTPGNLKYYNFIMNYIGSDKEGLITLEIKISNIFLRLFAPKLIIKYNPTTRNLVNYQGLSNITDSKNKIQTVEIKYEYPEKELKK